MAASSDVDGDPLLTLDVVREFMLSRGGKIHNHELVAHFKNFLNDDRRKVANRQKIKVFVNTLAVVKLDEKSGQKLLTLKKKYRESGNFGGDAKASATGYSSSAGQAPRGQKEEKELASKQGQSFENLTQKSVEFDGKEEYVLVSKLDDKSKNTEEEREKVSTPDDPISSPVLDPEEEAEIQCETPMEEEPPVVAETEAATEALTSSEKELESPESTAVKDHPDGAHPHPVETLKPAPNAQQEEKPSVGLSVKEVARTLNKIEEESPNRPLALKIKRENRMKVTDDNGGADYSTTFTESDREWVMACANCDYMTMYKMLQAQPQLARKRDFITGYAALHWAAKYGKDDMVKLLCGNGASVNVRSHAGQTPLHLAAIHNQQSVMELLVKVYNANVNIRDYSGLKPKQCLSKSATNGQAMQILHRAAGVGSGATESSSRSSVGLTIGKAMFLGMNIVGGFRPSPTEKENAPLPTDTAPHATASDDHELMPPPRDLPPVSRRKPVVRQKDTHSDSEMSSSVPDNSLHGSDSSPNIGTLV